MRLKIKLFVWFFLLSSMASFSQMQHYSYKRELTGIKGTWHQVTLPDEIFEKVSPDISDIRVFGITPQKDTIEAPYLLQLKNEKQTSTDIDFNIINTSHNSKGYYFTLEVPSQQTINRLQLDFEQVNFDWHIALEGSQDQKEWFSIINDYRIVSIKNEDTFYQFTHLVFPDSNYRFFRILVKTRETTKLNRVKAHEISVEKGLFNEAGIKTLNIQENTKDKRTEMDIELLKAVPVSYVNVAVNAPFDYYRPITITYVADSIKTENGMHYNYKTLSKDILNSFEPNTFTFENTIAKKLKIYIDNHDNQPLEIKEVTVKGNVYQLAVRFTQPAAYFLVYGNSKASKPDYDLKRFDSKTPDSMIELTIGEEQVIPKTETIQSPLFKNKLWLWGILILTIVILGWFSLKMIKTR